MRYPTSRRPACVTYPLAGTTRKSNLLVLEGIGNTSTGNNSLRSLAWLLGRIPHLAPVSQEVGHLPLETVPI